MSQENKEKDYGVISKENLILKELVTNTLLQQEGLVYSKDAAEFFVESIVNEMDKLIILSKMDLRESPKKENNKIDTYINKIKEAIINIAEQQERFASSDTSEIYYIGKVYNKYLEFGARFAEPIYDYVHNNKFGTKCRLYNILYDVKSYMIKLLEQIDALVMGVESVERSDRYYNLAFIIK